MCLQKGERVSTGERKSVYWREIEHFYQGETEGVYQGETGCLQVGDSVSKSDLNQLQSSCWMPGLPFVDTLTKSVAKTSESSS